MNKSSAIEKIKSIVMDNSIRDLVIRLNILSIPLVGSHLDAIYTHFENGFKEKHLIEKINVNNERQVELLTHAWQSVLRCDKIVKAEKILDILSDTFDKRNISERTAEDLINLVIELSENEAIIFTEIYKTYSTIDTKKDIRIYVSEVTKIVPEYNDNIDFYMYRLMGKGLLREVDVILRGGQKIYNLTSIGYQLFNTFHGDKK